MHICNKFLVSFLKLYLGFFEPNICNSSTGLLVIGGLGNDSTSPTHMILWGPDGSPTCDLQALSPPRFGSINYMDGKVVVCHGLSCATLDIRAGETDWQPFRLRHEVTGSNSAVINGDLVLLDGVDPNWRTLYNASAPGTLPPLYHWDRYDINKQEWKEENFMAPAKTGFCTIQLGENAVVITGGLVHPCLGSQCHSSLDPELSASATKYTDLPVLGLGEHASGTEHLPNLNHGRMFHACGTYSYEGRTMLIVAGGMDKMSVEMSTAEVYSEGDASWGLADNLFSPAAFLRGATIDNTFYLVGGWFDGGRRGEERSAEGRGVEGADDWIYEFEPERQKWVEISRMPEARHGHGVIAVPLKYFDALCKL